MPRKPTVQQRSIKLAVVGAMCSGKTTLVDSFRDVPGIACIPDGGRLYLAKHTTSNRSALETCQAIAGEYIRLETNSQIQLCDSCVLTPLAHLVAYGQHRVAGSFLKEIKPHLITYEHFFFLDPHDISYTTDAVRTESVYFRTKLHTAFKNVLNDLALPHSFVTGPHNSRFRQVRAKLECLTSV